MYRNGTQQQPDQWQELAQQLLDVRRPMQAEAVVRQRLSQHPRDIHAYVLLALALYRQQRPADALTAAQTALAIEPHYAEAFYAASLAYMQQNKVAQALLTIGKSLQLNPRSSKYLGMRAWLINAQAKRKQALIAAEASLSFDPTHAECLLQRTVALRELAHFASADDALTILLRYHPQLPVAHRLRGEEALRGHDSRTAQTHFQEALRLDPTYSEAQQLLTQVLRNESWWRRPLAWASGWKISMQRRGQSTRFLDKLVGIGQVFIYCAAFFPLLLIWLLGQIWEWRQQHQAIEPTPLDAWFFGGLLWGILSMVSAALLPPWLPLAYVLVGGGLLFPLRNAWRRYWGGEGRFPLGALLLLSPGSSALLNLYGFWGNPDPITDYRSFLAFFGVFLILYQVFRPIRRP